MAIRFTLARYPGFVLAWADEWPGMICGANSVSDLAREAPLAIAEYRTWLESNGEVGPRGEEWGIGESIDPSVAEVTGGDPCYAADRRLLTERECEQFLKYAAFAQRDLAAAAALPDLPLDWAPEGLVVEHADAWAPDPRTIRGILTHALQLEVFYREGLRDGPAAGIFEKVGPVAEEQRRTIEVLRDAAMGDLDRVFHPLRPHPSRPEPTAAGDWTIRKVLRRMISHDRAHAAEIVQRRTWILLGRPKQS